VKVVHFSPETTAAELDAGHAATADLDAGHADELDAAATTDDLYADMADLENTFLECSEVMSVNEAPCLFIDGNPMWEMWLEESTASNSMPYIN
jgi:hypothetical protein